MIIPIRCFTCNKLIADKWNIYHKQLQEEFNKQTNNYQDKLDDLTIKTIENELLDKLNITRYCCRRMMISNLDMCAKI